MFRGLVFVFVSSLGIVSAWIGEDSWTNIANGVPVADPFYPVKFEKHPEVNRERVEDGFLAYWIQSTPFHYEAFGQTFKQGDQLCAKFFSPDQRTIVRCSNFRVVKNSIPIFNPQFDSDDPRGDIVKYLGQHAIVIEDPEHQATFFGTLRPISPGNSAKELVGVDYNNNPFKAQPTGDNFLYIYRLKNIQARSNQIPPTYRKSFSSKRLQLHET